MNYPTQSEFEAALKAKGFSEAARSSVVMRFNPCCGEYRQADRSEPPAERRDSAEEMPLGVPRG